MKKKAEESIRLNEKKKIFEDKNEITSIEFDLKLQRIALNVRLFHLLKIENSVWKKY